MGGFPSTAHIKIKFVSGETTAIAIAYDYITYLESHPFPMSEAKRAKLAVPVALDEPYLGMAKGTLCWLIDCPHCGGAVLMAREPDEIRCGVFRHGVYKDHSGQIDPHASRETVQTLLDAGAVWGCGQPFSVDKATGVVSKCSWNDQPIVSDSDSNSESSVSKTL